MRGLGEETGVSLGERLSPLLHRWVALDSDYKSVMVALLIALAVYLFGIEVPW
jgi:hypothetical protein